MESKIKKLIDSYEIEVKKLQEEIEGNEFSLMNVGLIALKNQLKEVISDLKEVLK